MFHKSKHSGPQSFLKKDKAFKAALAKEYGVEKTPNHFRLVLEETYQKLPDSVPTPYRPVRRALRQAATVFAVLAVTFAALWGVNGTYPQLTEALPGLGPVFQAINGGKRPAPDPNPSPMPTASPKPAFQPVVMTSESYPGNMTVTNAWSDGGKLYLDMELDLEDSLLKLMQTPTDWTDMDPVAAEVLEKQPGGGYMYAIQPGHYWIPEGSEDPVIDLNANILVNSLDLHDQWHLYFSEYTGGQTVQAHAVADFGTDIEVGRELLVELFIPDFYVFVKWDDSEVAETVSPGFQAVFKVPVDRSKTFALDHAVQQNGVTLEALDFTPSYVSVDAELPYLGAASETLLPLEMMQDWGDALLGLYPELTDCSGSPVSYSASGPEPLDSFNPGQPMKFRFRFQPNDNPKELQGPLRLTFYELPSQNVNGQEIDNLALRRVVAEFTIELNTNQVVPTEYFRQEGREQVDIARDPASLADSGFINGFRVLTVYDALVSSPNSPSGWTECFELASRWDGGDDWPLVFKAYLKGGETLLFPVVLNGGDIQNEEGEYYEHLYTVPYNGEEYRILELNLHLPSWAVDEYGNPISFDRVELVDGETGMTLIPDLKEALRQSYRLEPSGTVPDALLGRQAADDPPAAPSQADPLQAHESEPSYPDGFGFEGEESSLQPEGAEGDVPSQPSFGEFPG